MNWTQRKWVLNDTFICNNLLHICHPEKEHGGLISLSFLLHRCFHSLNSFPYSKSVTISVVNNGNRQTLVAFGHHHLRFLDQRTNDIPVFLWALESINHKSKWCQSQRQMFRVMACSVLVPSVGSPVIAEATSYLIFEFAFGISRNLFMCRLLGQESSLIWASGQQCIKFRPINLSNTCFLLWYGGILDVQREKDRERTSSEGGKGGINLEETAKHHLIHNFAQEFGLQVLIYYSYFCV